MQYRPVVLIILDGFGVPPEKTNKTTPRIIVTNIPGFPDNPCCVFIMKTPPF